MASTSLRAFFAIRFPADIREYIDNELGRFRQLFGRSVRWTQRDHIHLTLKFIKRLQKVHITPLKDTLSGKASHLEPFKIRVAGGGCFPGMKNPRVIWLGIKPTDQIVKTAQMIAHLTNKVGYPTEQRPFSAHITIGRIRNHLKQEEHMHVSKFITHLEKLESPLFTINALYLIESTLTSSGPIYKDLFEIGL